MRANERGMSFLLSMRSSAAQEETSSCHLAQLLADLVRLRFHASLLGHGLRVGRLKSVHTRNLQICCLPLSQLQYITMSHLLYIPLVALSLLNPCHPCHGTH